MLVNRLLNEYNSNKKESDPILTKQNIFRYLIDSPNMSNSYVSDLYSVLFENDLSLLESEIGTRYNYLLSYYSNVITFKLKVQESYSDTLTEVLSILVGLEGNSYIVGGFVRDVCLGEDPKDIDFCTDINIQIIKEEFSRNGFTIKDVGDNFLVTIVTKNNETFEISNLRKDKDNSKGEIGDIYQDAQRRDFTINSGYYDINTETLLDPNMSFIYDIRGENDLPIVRFIGYSKDRLEEDPLRAFRFYRFCSKGYIPDKKSLRDVRRYFDHCVKNVSSERIRSELERICLK